MKNTYKLIKYVIENWPRNLNEAAYSEGQFNQLFTKFKEEADAKNINVSDEDLKKYIHFFDQLRNSGAIQDKDINNYSIGELIRTATSKKKFAPDPEDPNPTISDIAYESPDGSITVWNGARQENCVRYGADQPIGGGSRWCITQPGGSYWGHYRYGGEYGYPTFYLIKNRNLPQNNKLSFVAVQILQDGQYRYTNRENRPGMSDKMDWNTLIREIPWLSEIPNLRSIIQWIPFTPEEKIRRNIKPTKLSYENWLDLPVQKKLKYLQDFKGEPKIFSDMSIDTFLSKKLQGKNLSDTAEEIARTYGVVNLTDLLDNIESFTPANQRSILHQLTSEEGGIVREKIDPKFLKSPNLSFEVKKLITDKKIWNTEGNQDVYLVKDKKGKEVIVNIQFTSDNDILMGVYEDGFSYPTVKINKTTAPLLLAYPKIDKVPFKTALDLFKKEVVGRSFINKMIEKSREDANSTIMLQTLENGDQIIIDGNTFTAWKIEGNKIESIPINSEEAQAALAASESSSGLQQAAYNLVKDGNNIPENVEKEPLFNLLRSLPYSQRTGFQRDNTLTLIVGSKLFWVPSNAVLPTLRLDNTYRTGNSWRILDSYDFIRNEEDARSYIEFLRNQNLAYNDTQLESLLDTNMGSTDSKIAFVRSNPPITPTNRYIPIITTRNGEEVVLLLNRNNPSDSKALGKRGRLIRASIKPATARQLMQAAGVQVAPEAPPAAVRNVRAPRAAAQAAPAAAAAPAGEANAGVTELIANAGLTNGFNALPAAFRNRIAAGTVGNVRADRGANSRQTSLGNRGRVTGVIVAGQDRMYIIQMGERTIGQASFQPDARHFIITPTRALNMGRVGNFIEFISNQNNLTEKQNMKLNQLKNIIREEVLKELGFPYPGKDTNAPSQYQYGIMDTLKALQELGVKFDVQAVMDILYPKDIMEAPRPQIAEPDVKPTTKPGTEKRPGPLTPPKTAPKTKPKAKDEVKETKEETLVRGIMNKYKKLKK